MMGKRGQKGFPIALLACLLSLVVVPGPQAALACGAENAAGVLLAEDGSPAPGAARFDRLSTADGLPDDVVYSILQDRQGFMWFGTGNGLARYDGYQFTVYQNDPGDPTSLSHPVAYAMLQDRNDDLWIGTGNGLDRLDATTGTFAHYLSGHSVLSLYEDEAGILWVGTTGGLTHLDPANPKPAAYIYGGSTYRPDRLSGNLVRAITQDRLGEIWLGTGEGRPEAGAGLDRFDRSNGIFIHYRHDAADPASLGSGDVWTIYEDRQGSLWAGTDGGLGRFDRSSGTFTRYQHDPGDPSSLADNRVLTVREDSAGRLWIGTSRGLESTLCISFSLVLLLRDGFILSNLLLCSERIILFPQQCIFRV